MEQLLVLVVVIVSATEGKSYFFSPLGLYISDRNFTSMAEVVKPHHPIIGVLFTSKYCQ